MGIRHVTHEAGYGCVAARGKRGARATRGPWYRSLTLEPVDSAGRNAPVVTAQAFCGRPIPGVRNGREFGAGHGRIYVPGELGVIAQMMVPQQRSQERLVRRMAHGTLANQYCCAWRTGKNHRGVGKRAGREVVV